jgi:DNA invertase Pin-like site-specific DNA recombinase
MDIGRAGSEKVTPRHLRRAAYLYVRQSTLRQVVENTESTQRQYALRQRAVALGWPLEQVVVIDSDQGQSGASTADREGFQRLVRDVGLGRAGLVMGLEVSRLARNSTDWHRLLEICALTDTLIVDEDGLYDPAHFNDRLLLGLKGTMSEAELHVLRARLRGGILNKARRGELETPLPIGFVYDGAKRVVLDPDQQVQSTVRTFFETFRRTGSATATVKALRQEQLRFPRRARYGPRAGELLWAPLDHCGALRLLHNPRYAGMFFFGRTRTRTHAELGQVFERLPRAEWTALIPDAHVGYITGEEFEANQRRLRENAQAAGADRRRSPAREGPALLQGLVVCGVCGDRMTVRYHLRRGALWPTYVCQRAGIAHGEPICQGIPGRALDDAVGRLLMETVTPLTLEITLAVQQELQARWEDADRLRHHQVERARYEAELARRRYLRVDPDNRLVASELEAHWNQALRTLTEAQETYERQRHADRLDLDANQRARVLGLATDFPRLWAHPDTPDRERKRMVRLLIDDVTLLRTTDGLTAHVRFRGGTVTSLTLPPALSAWQLRQTSPKVVALIDQLLDRYTDGEIARMLNAQGYCSGAGHAFHPRIVERIRRDYGLRPRYQRLHEQGMLSLDDAARLLGIDPQTVKIWARHGLVAAHRYNDKRECLYEHPGEPLPVKMQGRRLSHPTRQRQPLVSNRSQEVQCGA